MSVRGVARQRLDLTVCAHGVHTRGAGLPTGCTHDTHAMAGISPTTQWLGTSEPRSHHVALAAASATTSSAAADVTAALAPDDLAVHTLLTHEFGAGQLAVEQPGLAGAVHTLLTHDDGAAQLVVEQAGGVHTLLTHVDGVAQLVVEQVVTGGVHTLLTHVAGVAQLVVEQV